MVLQVTCVQLLAARPVKLAGPPILGELLEGQLASLGVDILPCDDRSGDLVEPPLSIDLPGEVAGMLLALGISIPSPPLAVGALLDTSQGLAVVLVVEARVRKA